MLEFISLGNLTKGEKVAHIFLRITIHLNKATAISLAIAPVSSRLDYCNSLLFDCSEKKQKQICSV